MKQIPFSARWTIKEDDLIRIKDSVTNQSLKSKDLSTSFGVKYFFWLFPNGHNAEYRGKVIISFGIDIGNLIKVEASYNIKVESANDYSQKRVDVFAKSDDWGGPYCDTVELFDPERKFIVDGNLVLTVDGMFEVESDESREFPYSAKTGNELWKRNDSKDFLIIASDGKGIKAHKIVLKARSPVFAAMFRSNMKEALGNQVEINDFSFDTIELAIKFVYDYTDTFSCTLEKLLCVLQFSDKYDMKLVKDRLEGILLDQVNVTSVCQLMNGAVKSSSLKLQEKCFQFLTTAVAEKTPIAHLDILDKEVLLRIVRNSLYQNVETDL